MAENTEPKAEETQEEQSTAGQEAEDQQEQQRTETENLFHRLYLFGLGLQKDLETTIKNLVERGEMEAEEKEKMVDDLREHVKKSSSQFENKIKDLINQVIEGMNLVPKEKYETLEKRVQILETKVLELESRLKESQPE